MAKILDVIGKNFAQKFVTKRINGVPVTIKTYANIETLGNVVQTVAQTCFQDGEFHAENREIARRYAILKYFTDIDLEDISLDEVFKMTQGGNWFAQIEIEIAKLPLWAEIETAIDKQIDSLLVTQPTAFDKLCSDLSAIIATDNSQNLADVKEVLEKLDKVDTQKFVDEAVKQSVKKTKKK